METVQEQLEKKEQELRSEKNTVILCCCFRLNDIFFSLIYACIACEIHSQVAGSLGRWQKELIILDILCNILNFQSIIAQR